MIELQERLYTSTEVAEILGVSLRSVYRYLEESKLSAEVKTATGRHRFTKKNILDFLYPDGTSTPRVDIQPKVSTKVMESNEIDTNDDTKQQVQAQQVQNSQVTVELEEKIEEEIIEKPIEVAKPQVEEQKVEEEVDWLAKFREAAQKFKEEEMSQVGEAPRMEEERVSGITSQTDVSEVAEEEILPVKDRNEPSMLFYKSGLGGLKDIAQAVDKNSRGSGVEYVFTMNSGLSLFKPIKPFSMLHVYVKPEDREYYEKVLRLSPSTEDDSQICLVLSKNDKVFDTKTEMHGLYVVSKEQLLRDITAFGDVSLQSEAESVL